MAVSGEVTAPIINNTVMLLFVHDFLLLLSIKDIVHHFFSEVLVNQPL